MFEETESQKILQKNIKSNYRDSIKKEMKNWSV